MKTEKLISIDSSNNIYTICFWDLTRDEFIKSYSFKDLYGIGTILSDSFIEDAKIVFNNEDVPLRDLLIKNFEPYLLTAQGMLGRRVYGVFPSPNIKSYGYSADLIESVKHASNIMQYIIMKSKGL